jgi:hypothetical protein
MSGAFVTLLSDGFNGSVALGDIVGPSFGGFVTYAVFPPVADGSQSALLTRENLGTGAAQVIGSYPYQSAGFGVTGVDGGCLAIADFAAGALGGDVVDVSAFFASFGDLKAHSSQGGDDVVIALDFNDQLVLANTEVSTLSGTDFLFA